MTANLNVFKTLLKNCVLCKSKFFSRKLIRCYEESDKKAKKKNDVMGTLRVRSYIQ